MMDLERAELLRILEELSQTCPEYRFGQMIANLVMMARGDAEGALWDLDDDELLDAARKHLADINVRREPAV